ncbi:MAG: hypothetical protein AB4041_19510 [Microcystaceae cyanobacterium]
MDSNHSISPLNPTLNHITQQQEKLLNCQEGVLKVVEQMGQQQEKLIHTQGLSIQNQADLAHSMRQMMESQAQLTQVIKMMGEQIASNRAAIDRIECVMDYLMRQDGERTTPDA